MLAAAHGLLERAAAVLILAGKRALIGTALSLAFIALPAGSGYLASAGNKSPVAAASPARDAGAGHEDLRDDASPWGVASGAEWFGGYPKFNPLLHAAGVTWLRGFSMWHGIEPKQGEWNWEKTDALVADARANNIHLTAPLAYLAPWASAHGDPRKFPIKDMQYWRGFVEGVVARYHDDIKYWEIWNEFNGGGFAVNGTVQIYADLVRDAYDVAKKIDPTAKIGMNVANFDVGFLDRAIKAGAAGHFDYLAVHPYEILGGVADRGEVYFLSMADNLRKMLAANGQRADMPVWITEIGALAPISPETDGDQQQAEALAKSYILSIAAGFQRIFWFEAHGPSYGKGKDFGLMRADWTLRPSYAALKTIIGVLGQQPRYLGFLDLDKGGYGFVFQGQGGAVLAAWSPLNEEHKVRFTANVLVNGLAGKDSVLRAGEELRLTGMPLLITKVPVALVDQAKGNAGKPFPWGGDYSHAEAVSCKLGHSNINDGLRQINPQTTVPIDVDGAPARRMDFTRPNATGRYALFRVDPQFAPFGTKDLEITAVVRRTAPDQNAGLNLDYESLKGYVGAPPWFTIPADDQWHELTWKVTAANFMGAWGYNFRLNAISSPTELYIKEVRVKKLAPAQ
jgi:polysaccharide biosynthesis protein PslG